MGKVNKNSTKASVPPGYVADPSHGPMLTYQSSLPKLPVPTLSSTISKYLETVRPHLTPQEYTSTESAAREFESSALGKELQSRLEARAKEEGRESWLSEWWNDAAYMGYRDPVVVFVSYFYVHVMQGEMGPAKRAAQLVKAMLPFRALVETEQLAPETVKGAPLCMASYKWLFHSSRYPVKPSDTATKFDPATHDHVIFVRKNRFYEVSLKGKDGKEVSAADLEAQVQSIIEEADKKGLAPPVGALTSENRDVWTEAREHLLAASPSNAAALERIESALIVVALDDYKPESREALSWGCWVGNGRNRWYDKHQLIVFDNGRSGFLGEHSCMDGTPTLRMNEFLLASLQSNKIDLSPSAPSSSLPPPSEITLVLDDAVKKDIDCAERDFDELVGKHDLEVLQWDQYGKEWIKKFKVSPDAWAQMVKQLAFYKFKGRPAVTYESTQTRKYQLGRTEVTRSASNESKAWVESMVDPKASDVHRATLLRRACARHSQYSAWAADGQGVDRHLFGLKKLLREGEEVPGIYKDGAFARTSHWELSTSQLSSRFFDGWGYGEVVPDGYGLAYAIGDDYIRWTITSLKLETAKLKQCLAEAAKEVGEMMERAAKEESKSKL
ncbi:acyltransferase ChoActase/COT/CPT [Peniophora sp. CONT]|nr:acyltransferase ChoActase/COT/CPT [Peniophora sp. CONT]